MLGRIERWCTLLIDTSQVDLTAQFQGQLPGNVLPLPGFVQTMANTEIRGEPAIKGITVSFLSGFPAMAQIFGQFLGGPLSNRIGRK